MKAIKRIAALVISLVLCLSVTAAFAKEPALIGVPDDGTNLARALKLLESAGLIEIDPAAGFTPEIKDVTKYIYNIEIMPVAANTLTSTLTDFAGSIINCTYAVPFGLRPHIDGLIKEEQQEGVDNPFINVFVARTEDKDNETYKKIVDAYRSQLVAEFTICYNDGATLPVWDYDPDFVVEDKQQFILDTQSYESSKEGKTVVKVGICGADNGVFKACQKVLDENGDNIYIEVVEFDAYTLPNEALSSGEIDINHFQHKAFLKKDMEGNGYDLSIIGDTVIAPLAIYSQKYATLDELKEAAGLL